MSLDPSRLTDQILQMVLRLGVVATAWGFAVASSALGESDNALVAGVVARHQAIYSGRFEYHRRAGFANTGRLMTRAGTSELKYFETDWLVRSGEPPMVQLNHGGARLDVRYQEHSEGGIVPSVWIKPPSKLEAGIEVPRFVGTLWYPGTVAFIDQHRTECKRVMRHEVDGMPVEVVEWQVPPNNLDAFGVTNRQLQSGGMLRLSVASERGFVLPLIEYVAPDGRVAIEFRSSDFRQVGPSLFWPWHCRRRTFTKEGKEGFFVEYSFTAVERVNEPIPDDEFVIDLPKGTHVNDLRPGANGALYTIGESIVRPPIALPESLDMKAPFVDRSWNAAAVIGLAVAIGLLFVVHAVVSRRRKSA